MKTIQIDQKMIGDGQKTFVVAEVGINHNGDSKVAEELVLAASRAGADAVKFQTYVAEKRVPKDSPIYSILKQCELSHQIQTDLKALADTEGVIFFSTPFDAESVDFLADLDVAAYKIASFDLVNLKLVQKVASVGKPVIASRGMANREEIDKAVNIFEETRVPYVLLHCISGYPTPIEQANLNVIRALRDTYDCPVGYSDHTLGIQVAVYAVAVGAQVIEKHFTLDKNMEGPDHVMSTEPDELADLVNRIQELESILGQSEFGVYEAEEGTLAYRRISD